MNYKTLTKDFSDNGPKKRKIINDLLEAKIGDTRHIKYLEFQTGSQFNLEI